MNFTYEQFLEMDPRGEDNEEIFEVLSELFPDYEINTPERMSMFFAQIGHESADFKYRKENLNYRATVLPKIWSQHFTEELANQHGRTANQPANQEMIANIAYANRMDNGPVESGDGWRFRGRGYIQLTGRYNYTKFAEFMGMDLSEAVDYLDTIEGACQSALYYWHTHNLNKFADDENITACTKKINGGIHGLEDRANRYYKCLEILKEI